MNDRHMVSTSQPLRLSNAWRAFDLTRSRGVGSERVANENIVSCASDTRVTDGEASHRSRAAPPAGEGGAEVLPPGRHPPHLDGRLGDDAEPALAAQHHLAH